MTRIIVALLLSLSCSFAALASPVDLNTATEAELSAVSGINATQAKAIVSYRSANGPFTDVSQLTKVNGVEQSTLSTVSALLTISDAAANEDLKAQNAGQPELPTDTPSPDQVQAMVNINTAQVDQLQQLPGITSTIATKVVEYRTSHGSFAACQDLQNVAGVTATMVKALQTVCSVQ